MIIDRLAVHHKVAEALGLVLALAAWAWDINVQGISRTSDLYERELFHVILSAQSYVARDRLVAVQMMGVLLDDNKGLTKNEIFALAWSEMPAFRETWWEHANTNAMWLDRILVVSQIYGESLGLAPPPSFAKAQSLDNSLHDLLYPERGRKEAPDGTWKLIPRENVSEITQLQDEFTKTIQTLNTEVIAQARSKRDGERVWQLRLAGTGAILIVLGKLLAWRLDYLKNTP